MKKIAIIPIIFFFLLTISVKAQTQILPIDGTCPDRCTNSTLYTKGVLDLKLKICIYEYHEDCKYDCRINDTKMFETPSCNAFPKNDTSTALEKIYDELKIMKQQVYQNSPSITVHGTEYTIGELGKIWVQVLDASNLPVDSATCYVNIYEPCGNYFFEKALMQFLEKGIYYYDFLIPNEVGVYPTIVNCYYVTSTVKNNATSGIVDIGTTTSGDYTSTWILDTTFWNVRELLTNVTRQIQIRMNFTNVTQPALQTGLSIIWAGVWNTAPTEDSITVYILNFTSSEWIALPNKITDTGGSTIMVTNTIITTNATASGLVKNGTVSIKFNDTNITDGTLNLFKSDYVDTSVIAQFSPQYQQVIGSGEIHVSSPKNLPYTMTTLCGETTEITSVTLESACAVFTNTGEFDLPEGELEDNITITALETKENQYWKYRTPPSVSCDALYWIKKYNGTDWIEIDLETNGILIYTESDSSCNIFVPIDLVRGNTYEYKIKMNNFIKWEIDWSYSQIYNLKVGVRTTCDGYASAYNYTYIVPILNNTVISNDTYLSTCHHMYDDFYWSEYYYNASLTINTVGKNLQNWDELRFYRDRLIPLVLLLGEGVIVEQIAGLNYTQNVHYNNLYNLMLSMNNSIIEKLDAINASLWNKLYLIQGELQAINDNITLAYNLIGAINSTIMNKLYAIQDEIISVNNTIKEVNASIHARLDGLDIKLDSIQSDLTQIKGNVTEIITVVQEINSTTHEIVTKLDSLSVKIDDLNSSLVSWISTSLTGLENNLTALIISVNNTVISSNSTIMAKLYGIQDEIASLNQTIIDGLLNISNVTTNITVSQDEVIGTMISLFGSQAKKTNYAYLGGSLFGFTGLSVGEDNAVWMCKDNVTLAKFYTTIQNITGSMNKSYVLINEDMQRCTYGCVNNACVIPQYMIWFYVLIALVALFFFYIWMERHAESTGG